MTRQKWLIAAGVVLIALVALPAIEGGGVNAVGAIVVVLGAVLLLAGLVGATRRDG